MLLVLRGVVEGEDFQSSMFYIRDFEKTQTSSMASTATATTAGVLSGLPSVSRQSGATSLASTDAQAAENGLTSREIAGVAVGVTIGFIAMLFCLVICLLRLRRKRREIEKTPLEERILEKHSQETASEECAELPAEREPPKVEDLGELIVRPRR